MKMPWPSLHTYTYMYVYCNTYILIDSQHQCTMQHGMHTVLVTLASNANNPSTLITLDLAAMLNPSCRPYSTLHPCSASLQ